MQRIVQAGIPLFTGARLRAPDPLAYLRYGFRRTMAAGKTADLSQPRVLSNYQGRDCRPTITNQGALGSCAAWAGAEASATVFATSGRGDVSTAPFAHPGYLYQMARVKEQTFPQDAGSFPQDDLALAMGGTPLLTATQPYVSDPAHDYSALPLVQNPDLVLSYRPFYPSEGQVLENIWLALDAGCAVVLAMGWNTAFNSPDARGVLPAGIMADNDGGHAICIWGIVPNGPNQWLVLCANHWSPSWNPQVANLGYGARPGDFAIPGDYFTAPASASLIWELDAVTDQPLPQPQPQPQPQPVVVTGGSGIPDLPAPGFSNTLPFFRWAFDASNGAIFTPLLAQAQGDDTTRLTQWQAALSTAATKSATDGMSAPLWTYALRNTAFVAALSALPGAGPWVNYLHDEGYISA